MPVDTKKTKDGRVTTSKQVGYKRKDGKEEWYKCALSAYNKAEAKNYIQQISYVPYNLAGAANNILGELISAIETASGQVQDKERLKYFAEISLYKLKSFIEEDAPND